MKTESSKKKKMAKREKRALDAQLRRSFLHRSCGERGGEAQRGSGRNEKRGSYNPRTRSVVPIRIHSLKLAASSDWSRLQFARSEVNCARSWPLMLSKRSCLGTQNAFFQEVRSINWEYSSVAGPRQHFRASSSCAQCQSIGDMDRHLLERLKFGARWAPHTTACDISFPREHWIYSGIRTYSQCEWSAVWVDVKWMSRRRLRPGSNPSSRHC